MDEIVKIVFERNKERKLLTEEDVKKICFIVLNKKHYDFVKHVEILPKNPQDPSCAGVYYDEHIFFFFKETLNMLQNNFEEFTNRYEIDGANADIYNYLYLSIIFHELAHVRQHAIVNSKHNSIEKTIFSMFLELSNYRDFYGENYLDILTEVNANNMAIVNTNYIYNNLPKNFLSKNDYQVYQSFLLKTLLYDNYEIIEKKEEVVSPLERIMDNFNQDIASFIYNKCASLIYNTENFTIYKKLMLGLPISYLEYAYINLLNDRLKTGEKIGVLKKLQKNIKSKD